MTKNILVQNVGSSRVAIDVTSLAPGLHVPHEELAVAFGVDVDDDAYQFRLLGLVSETNQLLDSINSPYTIRQRDRGLSVLTADESDEYWSKRFRQSIGSMIKSNRRRSCVDESQLSDATKRKREREMLVQSMMISSIDATQKQIESL